MDCLIAWIASSSASYLILLSTSSPYSLPFSHLLNRLKKSLWLIPVFTRGEPYFKTFELKISNAFSIGSIFKLKSMSTFWDISLAISSYTFMLFEQVWVLSRLSDFTIIESALVVALASFLKLLIADTTLDLFLI